MNYKFNINDYVKIKLKDDGYQHIIDTKAKYNIITTKESLLKRVDKDGYYAMQMHDFMSMFGDSIAGFHAPFETDILIDSKDLERLENKQ